MFCTVKQKVAALLGKDVRCEYMKQTLDPNECRLSTSHQPSATVSYYLDNIKKNSQFHKHL